MAKRPIRLAELPLRFNNDDRLEYVDALKVKMRDLEKQVGDQNPNEMPRKKNSRDSFPSMHIQ